MTVIAVGPHPDDPEEGAGGTLARIASSGERLLIVYVTSGGKGIPGTEAKDAVKIREREARAACGILGAEPRFMGMADGACFPDEAVVQALQDLFEAEEPKAILRDIETGMAGDNYVIVPDRALAVSMSVRLAKTGDIVLVAGKGHEDYQEAKGERSFFSDRSVLENAIAARGAGREPIRPGKVSSPATGKDHTPHAEGRRRAGT